MTEQVPERHRSLGLDEPDGLLARAHTHHVAHLERHVDALDADAKRRLHTNPLRVLDSKNPAMQALIEGAPRLYDDLDEDSLKHFEDLQAILRALGLEYEINPRLVRGLDYYNHTVFEWVTDRLGAQGHRVMRNGTQEVWVKPMADGGRTLLLWNRGAAPARIAADWPSLGLPATVRLRGRDLWAHKDLGRLSGRYEAEVAAHGVVMVRLAP